MQLDETLARLPEQLSVLGTTDGSGVIVELEAAMQAQLEEMEARLETRLGSLELPTSSASEAATDVTVAVARLRLAAEEGRPFASELGNVVALAPQYPELALLSTHAQGGIATAMELTDQFAVVAATVREALVDDSAEVAPPSGWIAEFWARLQNMVQIRREDAPGTATVLAQLEAAQANVASGNFALAVEQLQDVRGVADAPLGAWMAQAQAYLSTHNALSAIVEQMLSDVADGDERSGS